MTFASCTNPLKSMLISDRNLTRISSMTLAKETTDLDHVELTIHREGGSPSFEMRAPFRSSAIMPRISDFGGT
jgi:hypothetical protein